MGQNFKSPVKVGTQVQGSFPKDSLHPVLAIDRAVFQDFANYPLRNNLGLSTHYVVSGLPFFGLCRNFDWAFKVLTAFLVTFQPLPEPGARGVSPLPSLTEPPGLSKGGEGEAPPRPQFSYKDNALMATIKELFITNFFLKGLV